MRKSVILLSTLLVATVVIVVLWRQGQAPDSSPRETGPADSGFPVAAAEAEPSEDRDMDSSSIPSGSPAPLMGQSSRSAAPGSNPQVVPSVSTPGPVAIDELVTVREPGTTNLVRVTREEAFTMLPAVRSWMASGVTPEDLAQARSRLVEQGFAGDALYDPLLVSQFLTRTEVEVITIASVDIPGTAPAGMPVSFEVTGDFPDPSFSFDRWVVDQDGRELIIRPKGTDDGTQAPALLVPVTMRGELPPLEPGTYSLTFLGAGTSHKTTIEIQ